MLEFIQIALDHLYRELRHSTPDQLASLPPTQCQEQLYAALPTARHAPVSHYLLQLVPTILRTTLPLFIPQRANGITNPSLLPCNLLLCLTPSISPAIDLHRVPTPAASTALRRLSLRVAPPIHDLRPIHRLVLGLRVQTHLVHLLVHQPTSLSQLIDRPHGINRLMQRPPGIEVLLDCRQQILTAAALLDRGVGGGGVLGWFYPCVLKGLVGGHACVWIDGKAAPDEVSGGLGDVAPVFDWGEGVVGGEDGLHFFQVGVAVERCVAAEEEVGYYADRPDVAVTGRLDDDCRMRVLGKNVHWLAVAGLLEDLGCHVSGCATCSGENVELLLVHDAGEAEVCNEQVGVVFGGAEEEVLGLEISMDDAVVV